jgi:hypothetical protein
MWCGSIVVEVLGLDASNQIMSLIVCTPGVIFTTMSAVFWVEGFGFLHVMNYKLECVNCSYSYRFISYCKWRFAMAVSNTNTQVTQYKYHTK